MFFQRIFFLLLLGLSVGCRTLQGDNAVTLTELPDKVRVEIGGELFTEYCFTNVPRPFCYPIMGPGDLPMTRHWPMKTVEGEEQDHPHHRSLWFAHGNVNGVDFWSEQKNFGKQIHERFLEVKSGKNSGVIRSENKWVSAEGKVICRDERTLRFGILAPLGRGQGEGKPAVHPEFIDFEITLKATEGDLVLGDTKEGTMAIRLAETMRLAPNKHHQGKPTGRIVQSTGVQGAETWGKRAAWCDYSGLVNGKTVGVAMFDHPKNPRHPTWWHVRDYGLFAANPFGIHDFEKRPDKTAGNFSIPSGQSATFRYRFVFHEGDEKQAKMAELYELFARQR